MSTSVATRARDVRGAQLSIYRDPANPNFTQFTIEGT